MRLEMYICTPNTFFKRFGMYFFTFLSNRLCQYLRSINRRIFHSQQNVEISIFLIAQFLVFWMRAILSVCYIPLSVKFYMPSELIWGIWYVNIHFPNKYKASQIEPSPFKVEIKLLKANQAHSRSNQDLSGASQAPKNQIKLLRTEPKHPKAPKRRNPAHDRLMIPPDVPYISII